MVNLTFRLTAAHKGIYAQDFTRPSKLKEAIKDIGLMKSDEQIQWLINDAMHHSESTYLDPETGYQIKVERLLIRVGA